jgi:hypothetical protein
MFQEDYALKSSMLGNVAAEQLIDQEKANKRLSQESKELKCNFVLAQSANVDLEKKIAELAEALKHCQDEKKIADEALEKSKKVLDKLQKTHNEDLSLIENLRRTHDKSSKIAEDLHANNADLARSLSSKEQRIQDLEKALTEQREASKNRVSGIVNKLKALFGKNERSLNDFSVRLAPLPADLGLPEFMEWIDAEFKALPEVISGANDFATAFSVESILKLLHDFKCADLAKFREKLPQFPDALSTSRIQPNEDIQAIRSQFFFLFNTRSPFLMSFRTTFLSLHALVSFWYFSMFSAALRIVSSIISFSTFLSISSISFAFGTLMLSFLISPGVIASIPKSRRKGMKLVTLDTVVLWDQIIFGNSSTHLPFFWSNKHFLIPEKIMRFALSTAPLDCG